MRQVTRDGGWEVEVEVEVEYGDGWSGGWWRCWMAEVTMGDGWRERVREVVQFGRDDDYCSTTWEYRRASE